MRKYMLPLFIITFIMTGCGSSVTGDQHVASADRLEEKQLIKTKATYIGLIDSHSIEVTVNGKPLALQINEKQYKLLEYLETNTSIEITYSINEATSQNLLETVDILS